jgi:hypothetical protein
MFLYRLLCQDMLKPNRHNVLTSTMSAVKPMCPSVYEKTSCHMTVRYNSANEGGSQIQRSAAIHGKMVGGKQQFCAECGTFKDNCKLDQEFQGYSNFVNRY